MHKNKNKCLYLNRVNATGNSSKVITNWFLVLDPYLRRYTDSSSVHTFFGCLTGSNKTGCTSCNLIAVFLNESILLLHYLHALEDLVIYNNLTLLFQKSYHAANSPLFRFSYT